MPLQHSPDEAVEPVTTYGAPAPEAAANAAAAAQDGPRYDTVAVKEILARAEAMQAHHRTTLTPEAIIALGQEVGVEPEFVRSALAQTEAKATTRITQPSARKDTRRKQIVLSGRMLTRKQRAAALVPAAFYLLFMPFLLKNLDVSSNAAFCFYVFLPAFLTLCVGNTSKSKRAGALGGGLLGFAATFTLLVVTALNHRPMPMLGQFMTVLAFLAGSGVVLGAMSAGLRQMISHPGRKRVRVRFVVETDEADEADEIEKGEWA